MDEVELLKLPVEELKSRLRELNAILPKEPRSKAFYVELLKYYSGNYKLLKI